MRTKESANISVGTDYIMTSHEAFSRPVASDYKETCLLLSDFGLPIQLSEIPEFRFKHDLIRWRRTVIITYLEN
jgi:hypothetical protein